MKITATKDMWFIIDGEIKHSGKIDQGKTLETIQEVRTFETEEEWEVELEALGLDKHPMGINLPNFEK